MAINSQPVIILVEPQLGENIGMCARAMLNCGLQRLRLVNPRQGWPNKAAKATAADADIVLNEAEVFGTLAEALNDCQRVFATTARDRSLNVPQLNVADAVVEAEEGIAGDETVAILFGPEASGLDNDAIARADTLLRFPTNPDFSSLNLAQAVLLFGWEWRRLGDLPTASFEGNLPTREEVDVFLSRLEDALDRNGFFLTPEMKPHSLRTLRSVFTKTKMDKPELQLLHGVLTALTREGNSESVGNAVEQ
ncbi:MAG: RNA methyltransferase [Verrucomicrobiales bacterium]